MSRSGWAWGADGRPWSPRPAERPAVELHPAVVEAFHAGVPLIAATSDRPPELHQVGAPQTVQQEGLFTGTARWSVAPGVADLATCGTWRSLAARCVAEAVAGSGPVHVNLAFREPLLGDPGHVAVPEGRPGGSPWHALVPAGAREPAPGSVDRLLAHAGRRGAHRGRRRRPARRRPGAGRGPPAGLGGHGRSPLRLPPPRRAGGGGRRRSPPGPGDRRLAARRGAQAGGAVGVQGRQSVARRPAGIGSAGARRPGWQVAGPRPHRERGAAGRPRRPDVRSRRWRSRTDDRRRGPASGPDGRPWPQRGGRRQRPRPERCSSPNWLPAVRWR